MRQSRGDRRIVGFGGSELLPCFLQAVRDIVGATREQRQLRSAPRGLGVQILDVLPFMLDRSIPEP